MGRFDDAIALYDDLLRMDPLHINAYKNFGLVLSYAGRYEEAKSNLNKVLEMLPRMAVAHFYLARIHLMQLQSEAAFNEAKKELEPRYRLCGLG